MRYKVGMDRLITLLTLSCFIIPAGTAAVTPQPREKAPAAHSSLHTDPYEFWQTVRLIPVKVMSIDRETKTIHWEFTTPREVKLGSVTYDDRTKFPGNFFEEPEGAYYLVYCGKHHVAYELVKGD